MNKPGKHNAVYARNRAALLVDITEDWQPARYFGGACVGSHAYNDLLDEGLIEQKLGGSGRPGTMTRFVRRTPVEIAT